MSSSLHDKRILICADASPVIGGGHVMRCLALSTELHRRGADIAFVTAPGTEAIVPALRNSNSRIHETASLFADCTAIADAQWGAAADLAIIDNYAVAAPEERFLRNAAARIMVIDDLADRAHDCDLLLDQNLGRTADTYRALVPPHCKILAGSTFALLRPEFASRRPAALGRRLSHDHVRRVIVSLGLSDVAGISAIAARAAAAALPDAAIDVVVAPAATGSPEIVALADELPLVRVLSSVEDMCGLMIAADLSIGAAGSSSWERCCLGLPSILVVLAENQRQVAARLDAARAACVVVAPAHCMARQLTASVARLASDHAARTAMSQHAASLVDGQGVERVASAIADIPWSAISR